MIAIGVILLGISLILFFHHRGQQRKLFSIRAARSMTVAELVDTASAVAAEIGGGSWRDYVKLWGEVTTDKPLYSEHKREPCVHFESTVTRQYEARSKDGKIEKKSEPISHNRQAIPFWLRDRTGKIKIDPDGAAIETIGIMDEFRPARSGSTLGYRYTESILPTGREVLVVGAVSDLTGEVIIGKPVKSDHRYIISLKNEEALVSATFRNARTAFYSMVVCLLLGLGCLIWGLWSLT